MAYQASQPLKDGNRAAAADLTGDQFRFVKLDADALVVPVDGVADQPWGVLQNAPRVTEEVASCVIGITKLVAGGAVSKGDTVGTDAEGRGVEGGTLGVFLLDGVEGDVVTAAVNCLNIQASGA